MISVQSSKKQKSKKSYAREKPPFRFGKNIVQKNIDITDSNHSAFQAQALQMQDGVLKN